MRSTDVEVRVVRVFTRDGAGGNHLGIHDGVLDAVAMQGIATALGYAETIFLGERDADGTVPVRIFTPASELPFAGHPLVGTAWHLGGATSGDVRLRCAAGVVEGRTTPHGASIDVTQRPAVEPATTVPAGAVAAWVARVPLAYEVVRLPDPDAVAAHRLVDRPDHRLVWAPGDGGADDVVRLRFFAAGLGVEEDAATGSAAVALAAVLRAEGAPSGALTVHQGAEIGSPSQIDVSWTETVVTIGGTVADEGRRSVTPGDAGPD